MESVLIYLAKANLLIVILYTCYWLLIRKQTFYQLNRFVLLSIIGLAFILPCIPAPHIELPILQKARIKYFETENLEPLTLNLSDQDYTDLSAHSDFQYTRSIDLNPENVYQTDIKYSMSSIPWRTLISMFYLLIAVVLCFRLIFQIGSFIKLIFKNNRENSKVIYTRDEISPFSFLGFIVMNPTGFTSEVYKQILTHEKVHVSQWHSIDLVIAELVSIICWFNPFVWILRHSIRLNLEYIADDFVIRSGEDRKSYQYHLLQISSPDFQRRLANNFNQSQLKNRITMMNSTRSSLSQLWRYFPMFPIILGLLFFINPSVAQTNEKAKKEENESKTIEVDTIKPKISISTSQVKIAPVKIKMDKDVELGLSIVTPTVSIQKDVAVALAPKIDIQEGISISSPVIVLSPIQTLSISNDLDLSGELIIPNSAISISPELAISAPEVTAGSVVLPDSQESVQSVGVTVVAPQIHVIHPISDNLTGIVGLGNIDEDEIEGIFVIIRNFIGEKILEVLPEELEKHDINLKFSEIEYDENNLLTKIHMEVKVGERYNGELTGYNNGQPLDEPLVFYLIKGENESFGIEKGIPEEIPSHMKRSLRSVTGLLIDTGNEHYAKGIYKTSHHETHADLKTREHREQERHERQDQRHLQREDRHERQGIREQEREENRETHLQNRQKRNNDRKGQLGSGVGLSLTGKSTGSAGEAGNSASITGVGISTGLEGQVGQASSITGVGISAGMASNGKGPSSITGVTISSGLSLANAEKNMYLVISQNTTENDLKEIEKESKGMGLILKFRDLEFDEGGYVKHWSISAKNDHGFSANLSNSFDKSDRVSKIFLYHFAEGPDRFGLGNGDEFEDNDRIPEQIKKILRETNSGYRIGSFE